jgi:ACS family D-galactonate transporter-like MFS transporter
MTVLGSRLAPISSAQAPRAMTRKRWVIIWLAFAGLSINYLDRSSLSVALPFMGADFKLSATQQGLIFAAFFWAYDFCQLAAGWYVDKVGPRKSFTLAAVWWSVFTMVTAFAQNFWSLFGARFLLGVGESPAPSTAGKVVVWFRWPARLTTCSSWARWSR